MTANQRCALDKLEREFGQPTRVNTFHPAHTIRANFDLGLVYQITPNGFVEELT